ncbi:MAG: hypothetical protein IJC76_05430 [Lachnospiraceae bacterium]|nr:hypothetical protein [Lachnospiraceae bacterium]
MSKKIDGKKTVINIVAGVIFFIILVGVRLSLSYLYRHTELLIFYFFLVWFDESLGIILFFLLFLLFFVYITRKDENEIKLKPSLRIFTVIALIYIAFTNIFEVSEQYEAVLIDNKKPSAFEYKYNIIKDAIDGNTITKIVPVENIEIYYNHYVVDTGRSSKGRVSYYIRFKIGDIQYSSLEERSTAIYVKELLKCKENIKIEYYQHTGMVKSIDGISKNNNQELRLHVLASRDEEKQEEESKEQESIMKEEEERLNNVMEYSVLSESIGKKLSEIEELLQKNSIKTSYKKVYISSKMYEVGCIAFYNDDIVYVVKDNLNEDMLVFPTIEEGMTRKEIIELLTDAGFSYECDEFECGMHGKDKLHTKGHSNGTYIPRQHTVWFSVDK